MRHEGKQAGDGRDARLTHYLCGELTAGEARALEAEIAGDAELAARLAALRSALAWVRDEAPAPAGGLDAARRAALRAAAAAAAGERAAARDGHAAAPPVGRVLRLPLWVRAAAAVAVVTGLGALWMNRPEAVSRNESAALPSVPKSAAAPAPPSGEAVAQAGDEDRRAGEAEKLQGLSQLGYAGLPTDEAKTQALRIAPLDLQALAEVVPLGVDPAATLALPEEALAFGLVYGRDELNRKDLAWDPATDAETDDLADKDALGSSKQDEFGLSRTLGARELAGGGGGSAAARGALAARCEVTDGYGRRYADAELLGYLRRREGETPRAMFFRYYGDNAVVRAAEDPLSTFAADVDTASYALTRNYLTRGVLPPKAAVRTEEFVNSFDQELPPPQTGDFALSLEAAPTPYAPAGHLLLRCGIKAREVTRAARKPLNLVFVVDKSGSMAQEGRLGLVREALGLLVDQVRDDDTIGIVAFDDSAHEVLQPTAGAERWKIREALRGLDSGGSTNAADGLLRGYAMAERAFRQGAVNRVVLASDGVANTGETDQARILEQVRRSAEAAVDLTTIGVGMGNHNDVFLERLADEGQGSCHYVDSMDEAKRVLVDGFTGAMQVVAREARVQLEFDPSTVQEWRQLGYENRALADADFRNERVDAGEIGAGHAMVALYEVRLVPGAAGAGRLATLRLRWRPDGEREYRELASTLRAAEARSSWELASPRLRLDGAVAQFAEFLRRSVHARGDAFELLREQARRLARELDGDPQAVEFRDLVDRAAGLVRELWPDDELALLLEEARRGRLSEAELECMSSRTREAEDLLQEARRNNAAIERRLQVLLDAPR